MSCSSRGSDAEQRSVAAAAFRFDAQTLAASATRAAAVFDFGGGLPRTIQEKFKADFFRELSSIASWGAGEHWFAAAPPQLCVFVSDAYQISKSLVPAWYGHRGHMEFPARRVSTGTAAITHELTHVFLPNGNRLLAEGLAVVLQAAIGGSPAFPNFGAPLHQAARAALSEAIPAFAEVDDLDGLRLADLDAIATPGPLELRLGRDFFGEDRRGQRLLYSIAGSFVRFLIDAHGMERLRMLYLRTPLVPLRQEAGAPARWTDVYGVSLAALERQWKSLLTSKAPHFRARSDAGEPCLT